MKLTVPSGCHGSDHAISRQFQHFRPIRMRFLALEAQYRRLNCRRKPRFALATYTLRQWIEQALTRNLERENRWSEAIVVGSLAFVENVKSELGSKAMHRDMSSKNSCAKSPVNQKLLIYSKSYPARGRYQGASQWKVFQTSRQPQ